jgi:hypothetical protein
MQWVQWTEMTLVQASCKTINRFFFSFLLLFSQQILHYFLGDDTIEILELNERNNGHMLFPMLLKRQKLPKVLPSELLSKSTPLQSSNNLNFGCYNCYNCYNCLIGHL